MHINLAAGPSRKSTAHHPSLYADGDGGDVPLLVVVDGGLWAASDRVPRLIHHRWHRITLHLTQRILRGANQIFAILDGEKGWRWSCWWRSRGGVGCSRGGGGWGGDGGG